ncbi:hypothetical protein INT47_012644 [Mucor saturninus]|uniref:VHS domain-containing protein n=1 Tax=Mucor saturninus TaxID=64648 RepID=A0A8H7R6J9_9FUNG|nr:hypothetical protein INT47_012644 [Mucor saturninus]
MGFFAEDVQKTSVSLYIERLSNLEEVDWYLLQQLTESIQMQESGPREAVETVRKKLKHGGAQQKLRVLEILKLLMENSNQQFHRQFLANEKLRERFELIITSSTESPAVKNKLVSLLGAWSMKYKSEAGMSAITELFERGRNKPHTRPRANTDIVRSTPVVQSPTVASRTIDSPISPRTPSPQDKRRSLPAPKPVTPAVVEQPKIVNKPRSHSSAAATTTVATGSNSGGSSPSGSGGNVTRVFNFEKAKPRIIEEIALANQNSNNLSNALKLINTSEERWEIDLQHDKRLQEYRDKCEESKKKIVRYARLVENEEWIGTLLATNEDLLKTLDMYDVMLVGEIPAAWLLAQQAQQKNISYYDHIHTSPPALPPLPAPKQIRAPPPPPPNRLTLQIQDKPQDDLDPFADPFADPVTPIEEENRR